jgi:hypothetical protein
MSINRKRTIWDVFEEERGKLVEYRGPFDGFHCVSASVSKICTVRFDTTKYSVLSTAVGRLVEIQAYAESHRHPLGRHHHRRACPQLRPRRDGL